MRLIPSLASALASTVLLAVTAQAQTAASCAKPVYLTVDTGHMAVANVVAEVLNRQKVRATFFASNDRATVGGSALSTEWELWWKARGAEGHEFASRTYDPVSWQADLPGLVPKFRVRYLSGGLEGRDFTWDAPKYCENITNAAQRLKDFTGKPPLPLFRAPGGQVSSRLAQVAKNCGYVPVGWSPAAVLSAERPTGRKGHQIAPLDRMLKAIHPGDIMRVQLGGSTEDDVATQGLLEPLIVALKADGYCFATLREHPAYRAWIAAPHPVPAPQP